MSKHNLSDYSAQVEKNLLENMSTNKVARILSEESGAPFDACRSFIRRKKQSMGEQFTSESETKQYAPKSEILTARKEDGTIMTWEEFYNYYGLNPKDVKSYKLITHNGVPTYNVASHILNDDSPLAQITPEFIEELVKKHTKKFNYQKRVVFEAADFVDRLVFTDTHIGMEVSSRTSDYKGDWGHVTIMDRLSYMMEKLGHYSRGNELYILDLGDFMDGYEGYTARRDHKLPQAMDTKDAFDLGLEFKLCMLDAAVQMYSKVVLDNVCNDNHGGNFAYLVNSAVKKIAEHRYHGDVVVNNHETFMSNYNIGDTAFVFSHGKDEKFMKSGMKAAPDANAVQKVDGYCKNNGVYRNAKNVLFEKGDSHQCVFDFTTSDDFPYLSYPSFAPQSEWVQTNFKRGQSGFVVQNLDKSTGIISFTPIFFKD